MKNKYNIEESKCMVCNNCQDPQINPLSYERLSSLISASRNRQDSICETIEQLVQDDVVIFGHCIFVSTYTSNIEYQ